MTTLYDTLVEVLPDHDPEILDGYRRYESLLSEILTPEQIETYAAFIRRTGTMPVFDEMSTEDFEALSVPENVVAMAIIADENAALENRRVASLLNQREQGISPAEQEVES